MFVAQVSLQRPNDDYALSSMIKQTKKRNFNYRMGRWKDEINHRNQLLMNKLMAISTEKKHYLTHKTKRMSSLNNFARKRENKRITLENHAFVKRLYHRKGEIDVNRLEQEYKDVHLSHKRRLRKMKPSMFDKRSSADILPPISAPNGSSSHR